MRSGELCVSWMAVGSGYRRSTRFELGETIRVDAGRQQGVCGGVKLLSEAEITATVARDLGSGKPLAPQAGHGTLWTPTEAGIYYVTVAAPAAAPVHTVVVIAPKPADPPLRISLPAAWRDGDVMLRLVPPSADAALQAGFDRERWPRIFEGTGPSAPLELAAGDYELSSVVHGDTKLALLATRLKLGQAPFALPESRIAIQAHVAAGQRRAVVLTASDGAQVVGCFDGGPRAIPIEWRAPPGTATLACGPVRAGEACALPADGVAATTTLEVAARRVASVPWPKSCE